MVYFIKFNNKNSKPEIFSTNGMAIDGYDIVSIFKDGSIQDGKKDFSYEYKGAKWQFINELNLSDFKSNPESYVPQYGGYCAYGMSKGYKAPTQIETWTKINDKLYLNYNSEVKKDWLENRDEFILKANKNWIQQKHQ